MIKLKSLASLALYIKIWQILAEVPARQWMMTENEFKIELVF